MKTEDISNELISVIRGMWRQGCTLEQISVTHGINYFTTKKIIDDYAPFAPQPHQKRGHKKRRDDLIAKALGADSKILRYPDRSPARQTGKE
jgi:hypothetical protein